MDHKDLCEHTRIRLIAAAVGHQQCTKTASNIIPLPGTDRVIAIGTPAQVAQLLPEAPDLLDALQKAARLLRAAGFAMTGTATSQIVAAIEAHAQQEAAQAVPSNASVKDMLRWLGVDTDYHGKIAFTLGQFARFVGMLRAAPTTVPDHSEREAANAGGLATPILANGVPVEQTQMDWVCRFISENSIFDGSDILRAWNELVTFYVAHRAAATIAAGQEAANAGGLLPHDWKDRLYAAMNAAFELRRFGPRDEDGQHQGMRIDDTQIGVEFAMDWLEKSVLAASQSPATGTGQEAANAKDAARYRVLRQNVRPADVSITMTCIPPVGQSSAERIDMLCDLFIDRNRAAMAAVGAAGQEGGAA